MRVFKIKWFHRFARKQKMSDDALCQVIERAERGIIDADLGMGDDLASADFKLIKQRVARPGRGRSGGYRTVIAMQSGDNAFFLFGFAKSSVDNIDDADLVRLRKLAGDYLVLDEDGLTALLDEKSIIEITCSKSEEE